MRWHLDTSAIGVDGASALDRVHELSAVVHAAAVLRADGLWDVLVEHDDEGRPVRPPPLRPGGQLVPPLGRRSTGSSTVH